MTLRKTPDFDLWSTQVQTRDCVHIYVHTHKTHASQEVKTFVTTWIYLEDAVRSEMANTWRYYLDGESEIVLAEAEGRPVVTSRKGGRGWVRAPQLKWGLVFVSQQWELNQQ